MAMDADTVAGAAMEATPMEGTMAATPMVATPMEAMAAMAATILTCMVTAAGSEWRKQGSV